MPKGCFQGDQRIIDVLEIVGIVHQQAEQCEQLPMVSRIARAPAFQHNDLTQLRLGVEVARRLRFGDEPGWRSQVMLWGELAHGAPPATTSALSHSPREITNGAAPLQLTMTWRFVFASFAATQW